MARFLITYLYTPQADVPISPQVFKLKHACGPEDVIVPENTIAFSFVNRDFDSVTELEKTFIGIRVGQILTFEFGNDKNEKIYLIGKLIHSQGIDWVVNYRNRTRIPSTYLGDNYVIIDM